MQASLLAQPPISQFRVGAALLGQSGRVYLGFNLEFSGVALHHTVHAEQCALSLAHSSEETGIVALAVSAAPCGHCRQFLNELGQPESLQVLIGHERMTLADLLPRPFGPRDLNVSYGLLASPPWPLELSTPEPLAQHALRAARRSYAPYSGCAAGIALEMRDGRVVCGSYAENAAFNPSFLPLQAAFCQVLADAGRLEDVSRAVLVQRSCATSLECSTRALLTQVAPLAVLECLVCS